MAKYNQIDVHIISNPIYDRTDNLNRLADKLLLEPVNVHIVQGVPNNIGAGRYAGFTSGTAPLVSYIDDDDDFIPGIFEKILTVYNNEPAISALCTQEIQRTWAEDGSYQDNVYAHIYKYFDHRHALRTHHLAVFKRDVISPYLPLIKDLPDGSEHSIWIYLLLNGHLCRAFAEIGYIWNIHKQDSKSLKLPKPGFQELHMQLYQKVRAAKFKSNLSNNPFWSTTDERYLSGHYNRR